MSAKKIVKVNIMGEILSRDVTLLTCRQKIIVKVKVDLDRFVPSMFGIVTSVQFRI